MMFYAKFVNFKKVKVILQAFKLKNYLKNLKAVSL